MKSDEKVRERKGSIRPKKIDEDEIQIEEEKKSDEGEEEVEDEAMNRINEIFKACRQS